MRKSRVRWDKVLEAILIILIIILCTVYLNNLRHIEATANYENGKQQALQWIRKDVMESKDMTNKFYIEANGVSEVYQIKFIGFGKEEVK